MYMLILGFFVLVLIGTFVYFVTLYNRLISLKHNVDKAWSNIDVLLKQRHDELPKLVETVKQYMGYEQETIQKVVLARSQAIKARKGGDAKEIGAAEETLRGGLGNLFALAEDYPGLKADESFNKLQSRISVLEEKIADRREFYNEAVNNKNVRIEQFPDLIIAFPMRLTASELLEFDKGDAKDHDIFRLFGGNASFSIADRL